MLFDNSIPYCGSPPVPGGVTWNFDPILWSLLALSALAYSVACRHLRRDAPARHEQISFALGWTILALALISPLCNLSVALFSARVGQHMKVRNSLKSLRARHRDNQLVRRKGRVYIINKTQKRFKARQG